MKVASSSVAFVRLQATHTAPSKRAPVSGAPVKSNPPPWLASPASTAPVKSTFCMSVALLNACPLP